MHRRLFSPRQPAQAVRIRVAAQQRQLEEKHAARPHGRASSEPRQDELRDQRLHLKQQERARDDGDAEEKALDGRPGLTNRRRYP